MVMHGMFLAVLFSTLRLGQGISDDVQYAHRLVSGTKGDLFGYSLATSHSSTTDLIVGAPRGKRFGYVLMERNMSALPPNGFNFFGESLDIGKHYVVVSSRFPPSVFVYSSMRPYQLKAWIPVTKGFQVKDVKVTEDNAIVVALCDGIRRILLVYKKDREDVWSFHQKIVFDGFYGFLFSLAVSTDHLAVGYTGRLEGNVIKIYRRKGKHYTLTTTLRPPESVEGFGYRVAMDGVRLVVSTWTNILFTFNFNSSTGVWENNGRLITLGAGRSVVSLHRGVLAVTVDDSYNHPDVCAVVYRLSAELNEKQKNYSSSNGNVTRHNYNGKGCPWHKVATLRTSGLPLKQHHSNFVVKVLNNMVYTGRPGYGEEGEGMVFVHDVSKSFQ